MRTNKKVAVLIPCYNEAQTIEKVVGDFRRELPGAEIFVYDNNSEDDGAERARRAGAVVVREARQGKGNVVRSMFRDVDADFYLLVDGDDTNPAEKAAALLSEVERGVDMAVGDRLSNGAYAKENKRGFHHFGNNLVLFLVNRLYGSGLSDIMSGYRAFSRRFVKTYPALCEGFQLETDMTVFALSRGLGISEIPIDYRDRPEGSQSKLNTFSDGFRVLSAIFNLYRFFHPLKYFGILSAFFLFLGMSFGVPVIVEFMESRFVSKIPSAVLASGLMVLSIVSLSNGLILDSINRSDREEFERALKGT
jgi:glycosyltransferase involved in cell wall biosynthesis